jgi:hypothetical protein
MHVPTTVERSSGQEEVNLDTCKFVVWGFKNHYTTHTHIHESFFRTLRWMGRDVEWLDDADHRTIFDWSNVFYITNWDVSLSIPVRDDCFYLIHGGGDSPEVRARFGHLKNRMSWNVFIDYQYEYTIPCDPENPRRPVVRPGPVVWVDQEMPFFPEAKHMDFRWATDMTPEEIERNKHGAVRFRPGSKVINYVGTYWHVNEKEIHAFERACGENGVELRHIGGGQVGVVSIDENIRLVRESRFAPAIVGSHHLTEGYAPCRIFKNISYGQFGVTNSAAVQRLFEGRLICDTDPYQLFATAESELASKSVADLHALMDFVSENHTYVNRINGILEAARMVVDS